MKTILVTGCGGAPTINFVRSLRDVDPKHRQYRIVGVDYDRFTLHRHECDEAFLVPGAAEAAYLPCLLAILKRERVDFLHTQPEIEVFMVGKHRRAIEATGCRLLMPAQRSIEILRDKLKSYQVWAQAGLTVPRNIAIGSPADLRKAFRVFGKDLWIRETIGAAGKGSLSRPSYDLAKAWIEYRSGWGHTVAAEHLTTRTVTWQSLWHEGQLVIGQGRARLTWEAGNRTQSGVTGITGVGVINNDPEVVELALKAISAVDPKPHGIFSVDFTYDHDGVPNPTEINIGKFFTTHHFLSRAGANMPAILVELAFDCYKGEFGIINPCPEGLCWIRGIDVEPVLLDRAVIDATQREYQVLLDTIKANHSSVRRRNP